MRRGVSGLLSIFISTSPLSHARTNPTADLTGNGFPPRNDRQTRGEHHATQRAVSSRLLKDFGTLLFRLRIETFSNEGKSTVYLLASFG
jgi:hypothetical protein